MQKSLLVLLSLVAYIQTVTAQDYKGLKGHYRDYFTVGVSVAPQSVEPGDEAELIKKNFASLTAENVMKPQPIHPEEGRYHWEPADQIVNFAQANGLKVRGHTLCWHNQTPDWFFEDKEGRPAGRDLLLERLRDHIHAVVGRYKGKIYAWDVVNEAVSEKPDQMYRPTKWQQMLGEEYIAKAFEYAHEADPDALLFYNDFDTEKPAKREHIYKMLKGLLDKGVPVHGMGLQGHWSIYDDLTAAGLEESITRFASLGLTVQVTELDVSIYPKDWNRKERRASDTTSFTPEKEQMQIDKYQMIFDVLRKHKDKVSGVTFWNVSDRKSWLDTFPIRGRKDYPLLFDEALQPKKAYWKVVDFEK